MMNNLLDPDPEFQELNISELRSMMSRNNESVLRRGRAMMELGRRASSDPVLLQEVSGMIRAQENRQLMTVGTTSVSQLGTAGLIAGGSKKAIDLAAELVQEWHRDEQSDFAWLMKSSGIAWPRG
ncbi:MAG TPA: hypothetical protein VG253_24535 [Streptosporangiaceae bacterium]|jgi:hypothetical protein|nr:hypothetical protein [Streptosporangiaceae bacterium]